MPANPEVTSTAHAPSNGQSSIHDLFALTDEQILEIDPEPQDVEVSAVEPATQQLDATSTSSWDAKASGEADSPGRAVARDCAQSATNHQAQGDGDSALAEPPQWLADRMSDPQHGAEAHELWNSSRAALQEAAAFREVFAKPDDARAAAQRARLLDDIDRAYFTGDATQRASLAASMLHEDPAAFREMVFAGLRALEQAGHAAPATRDASATATSATTGLSATTTQVETTQDTGHASRATNHGTHDSAALAAYTAFERSANEDLERTVGTAIDRTLDQALPHATRADSAAMKTRLAATIRQDIEKALQGDRQLGEQVAQLLSARRFDNESRSTVVRLIGERAQQLVPGVAKRVLSEWTQTTLSAHRSQRDRTDAAATRREVEPARSAGGPASTSGATQSGAAPRAAATARSPQPGPRRQDAGPLSRPGSNRGVDYRRLSDEQILDL